MNNRTSYIVSGAFWNFLGASILTMIAAQLATTVDAMIVGCFISSEALSGINSVMPVTCLLSAVNVLFGTGAGVRISRMLGNQKAESIHRAFSAAILSILIVGAITTIYLWLYGESLIMALCSDKNIATWAVQYMSVFAFSPLFIFFSAFLIYCLQIEGKPQLACKIILFSSLMNVLLDLTFICVFGWGIAGAAVATLLSMTIQIILAGSVIRKNKTYRLCKVSNLMKEIGGNMLDGVPMTVSNLALALLVFLLNTIILRTTGTVGMNIWSVCIQILMLALMILNGVGNATITIGNMLKGEQDNQGVALLHSLVFRYVGWSVLGLTAFMLIVPQAVLLLFGASEAMMQAGAENIVRVFALCLPFFAWVNVRQSFLIILQYYLFGSLVSLFMIVFILGGVWLLSVVSPPYLWWGFAGSLILLNVLIIFVVYQIHCKHPGTSKYSLIPLLDESKSLYQSVAYNQTSLNLALRNSEKFLLENGVEKNVRNQCMLLMEEFSTNIVQFASNNKVTQHFDVCIRIVPDEILFILKDDGKQFNPILLENNRLKEEYMEKHIGLKIINGLDAGLTYRYMYGQNIINVKLGIVN